MLSYETEAPVLSHWLSLSLEVMTPNSVISGVKSVFHPLPLFVWQIATYLFSTFPFKVFFCLEKKATFCWKEMHFTMALYMYKCRHNIFLKVFGFTQVVLVRLKEDVCVPVSVMDFTSGLSHGCHVVLNTDFKYIF